MSQNNEITTIPQVSRGLPMRCMKKSPTSDAFASPMVRPMVICHPPLSGRNDAASVAIVSTTRPTKTADVGPAD